MNAAPLNAAALLTLVSNLYEQNLMLTERCTLLERALKESVDQQAGEQGAEFRPEVVELSDRSRAGDTGRSGADAGAAAATGRNR